MFFERVSQYFCIQEHETAEEVATAIRIAVIDGKHQSHFKDRAILDAVYDIDILPAKGKETVRAS